jgi:hypothetical protein
MKSIDLLSDDELLRELRLALRELPDAPPAWRAAAIALWSTAAPQPTLVASAAAVLRRVLAELSFDSWAAPALAHGMRSGRVPTRHLLFTAEGRDLDLRVVRAAGAFSITGQVLGPDDAGVVELAAQGEDQGRSHRVALDALGEFHIDGVAPGLYAMTLLVGDAQIVLPPLDVGDTPH